MYYLFLFIYIYIYHELLINLIFYLFIIIRINFILFCTDKCMFKYILILL